MRTLCERCLQRSAFDRRFNFCISIMSILFYVRSDAMYDSSFIFIHFHLIHSPFVSHKHGPAYCLPSLKLTTAHLPPHAHFLAPLSPPPPSMALSSSSLPLGRPTTTSALTVRKDRMRKPEPGPRGPMASGKGVVGSQNAYIWKRLASCSGCLCRSRKVIGLTSPVNLR
jgi:hypothetical protein